MHHRWKSELLGNELYSLGYGSFEIDESEIIGDINEIYWMFWIIERNTKDAIVYCALNNRTKDSILPIIKNNAITNENEKDKDKSIKTRVYSYYFLSYQG